MNPARRRAAAAAVALVVVLVAIGGALRLSRESEADPRTGAGVRPVEAAEQARAACREVTRFEALARQNAKAARLFSALDDAIALSRAAATADPIWVRLASGLQTLRVAFEDDNADAARLGITLVRTECTRLSEPR